MKRKQEHSEKIEGTEDAWDERRLGCDEEFAEVADIDEKSVDSSLELQQISIRLQKSLIEDFKAIAQINGIGYQPLMRQILKRFAESEKKRLGRDLAHQVRKEQEEFLASEKTNRASEETNRKEAC
jgi:predicted DNA binding CopG/RHH family protein